MDALKSRIRHVPDFPKAGILFYDVTTLLRDPDGFRLAIDSLATPVQGSGDRRSSSASRAAGSSSARPSRIGSARASCPCASSGKLPSKTVAPPTISSTGRDSLEMHRDAIEPGQRVLIVDDLLATGGTARATVDLVKQLGGHVEGVAFLIELVELNGRVEAARGAAVRGAPVPEALIVARP